MNTEALNCRCCGGVLKVDSALCICEYCGTTNFISNTAGKYITQLNRANKLRQEKEYDNAIRIYDAILSENIPTADILWLRTLCEYGIEYVPDPVSSKYFPTLHRIKDESILNYHSYLEALELCDDEQKAVIINEAKEINRIQAEYLEIAKKEAPYDIFICYKETDEETKETTEDVQYCSKLYNILTEQGYKVFFARITLLDKLSVDYEPYIFAALKSSKAMAVIGSKSEYFTSTWVKNEWSRFIKLMEKDNKKQIFFACDDPNDLPRAFSLKQAQLLSNPNAMEILARNINRYLRDILAKDRSYDNKDQKGNNDPNVHTYEGRYKDVYKKCVKGNYPAVLSATNDLIKTYPGDPELLWLRMCANYRHNPNNIQYCKKDISTDPDYQKAIIYADPVMKKRYEEVKDKCLENIRLQNEFNSIMDQFSEQYEIELAKTDFKERKRSIEDNLKYIMLELEVIIEVNGSVYDLMNEREKEFMKLDALYRTVLNDIQNKGIAKYRQFCSEHNIGDKTEINMESVKYKAFRSKLVQENKSIRSKYR